MTDLALSLSLGQDWQMWAILAASVLVLFLASLVPRLAWRLPIAALALAGCLAAGHGLRRARSASLPLDMGRCALEQLQRGGHLAPGLDLNRILRGR